MKNLLLMLLIVLSGCSGARLSSGEARRKITEIATSGLVPDAVEVRRIVAQNDNQVIAETTVTLAFQFRRDNINSPWRVAAVRLGDRDWIDLNELLAAINEGRRRETTTLMEKLVNGIDNYRRITGSAPQAVDIVQLTNVLHPQYMADLIRSDGWGHPIAYEVTGGTFHLISNGADGVRGTSDDIVLPN
jgi:hypothetical protein